MKRKTVSASEIGRVNYCEKSLEYQLNGVSPNRQAQARMQRGNRAHEKFNRAQTQDSRCYIATHVYGASHSNTQMLRQWRDQRLATTKLGRVFITMYYTLSPTLVAVCQRSFIVDKTIRTLLDRFCIRVKRKSQYQNRGE